MIESNAKITMLCGGVGGARGALALYENLPPENLTFVVNTGDDFTHLGLEVWPDWDTVVYHLGQVQEQQRGWGRADEGERVMEELRLLGAADWFHLGDRDVALHLFRTSQIQEGESKHSICTKVCRRFHIESTVLPATEQSLQTHLITEEGNELSFQDYFVRQQCKPKVFNVLHKNAEVVAPTAGVCKAIVDCDVLIMAPSNPYLSLGPMLAVPELAQAVKTSRGTKIAVSPLIGGKAVKGPLDSLISTLSEFQGLDAIIDYWQEWVDQLVVPSEDLPQNPTGSIQLVIGRTWLKSSQQRREFVTDLKAVLS